MRLLRQRIYITSLAVMLTIGLGAALSTKASALSLGDVTNALGGVLGLNDKSESTPAATKAQPKSPTAQPAQTVPTQSAQSTTTVPQATTADAQQPAISNNSSTQLSATPVAQVDAVTTATKDTGTIVKQVASAQTSKSIAPVTYTTKQISNELRDELFAVAAVVTIIGAASYGMTFASAASPMPVVARRPLYIK